MCASRACCFQVLCAVLMVNLFPKPPPPTYQSSFLRALHVSSSLLAGDRTPCAHTTACCPGMYPSWQYRVHISPLRMWCPGKQLLATPAPRCRGNRHPSRVRHIYLSWRKAGDGPAVGSYLALCTRAWGSPARRACTYTQSAMCCPQHSPPCTPLVRNGVVLILLIEAFPSDSAVPSHTPPSARVAPGVHDSEGR